MKMKHLLLAAAVVVAIVSLLVSGKPDFTFYKLSLQWPPSACTFRGKECIPNIPNTFTIHGFWPQYDNDKPVPKYDKDHPCTTIRPTPEEDIIDELKSINGKLKKNWPNLYLNQKGKRDDAGFWKYEWREHGMCSDYPNKPHKYFNQALLLHQKYNPLEVMGIQPGQSVLQVSTILETLKQKWGAYPQIACNIKPVVKTLQLWEIRLCFQRPNPSYHLRDCPNKLDGACEKETDKISFPLTPTLPYSDLEMIIKYKNVSDMDLFNFF